jgi:hypothetical protein
VREALSTLAFVFPKADIAVEKWYPRQGNDNMTVLSWRAEERALGEFRH